MKLVTVAQMREFDRRTIEESNIPGEDLMDRAGWGVALPLAGLALGWPVLWVFDWLLVRPLR